MKRNRRECPNCKGNCKCPECNGKGKVYEAGLVIATVGIGALFGPTEECKVCKGTGKCKRCFGKGHIPKDI